MMYHDHTNEDADVSILDVKHQMGCFYWINYREARSSIRLRILLFNLRPRIKEKSNTTKVKNKITTVSKTKSQFF